MKETLARLSTAWANLPQSTKLLLAGLLLVSAVSLWYVGLFLPTQVPQEALAPTPQGQEIPRALEVPPIPPLSQTTQAQPEGQEPPPRREAVPAASPVQAAGPAALPVPQPRPEAPPPNPFVPLIVEAPRPQPPRPPRRPPRHPPQPRAHGRPSPCGPGRPSAYSQPPYPSPAPSGDRWGASPAPGAPAHPRGGGARGPVGHPRAGGPASGAGGDSPRPGSLRGRGPRGYPSSTPPKTPLVALVEERGLRLSGTLLGPVSVAILESKEGYLVLPAGSSIPGSEALLRRIEGDRVVLAMKDETLEIPLEDPQAGGER